MNARSARTLPVPRTVRVSIPTIVPPVPCGQIEDEEHGEQHEDYADGDHTNLQHVLPTGCLPHNTAALGFYDGWMCGVEAVAPGDEPGSKRDQHPARERGSAHSVGLSRQQRFPYIGALRQYAFQIVLPLLDLHLGKIHVDHHTSSNCAEPAFRLPRSLTVAL